jgi:hypothetical protein
MSFSLTTPQFIDGSKDVTRRLGWDFLKVGDRLTACEKCQGIQKGGLVRLGEIEILHVSRQPLSVMRDFSKWGQEEAKREGFPEMSGEEFVKFFCREMKCEPSKIITRIEFRKADYKTPENEA